MTLWKWWFQPGMNLGVKQTIQIYQTNFGVDHLPWKSTLTVWCILRLGWLILGGISIFIRQHSYNVQIVRNHCRHYLLDYVQVMVPNCRWKYCRVAAKCDRPLIYTLKCPCLNNSGKSSVHFPSRKISLYPASGWDIHATFIEKHLECYSSKPSYSLH